jgi:hypothetical protein
MNYSTTGSTAATKTAPKTSTSKTTVIIKYKWMPLLAIKKVLGFIFLPFIDLFRQCGFTCCCRSICDCTSTSFNSLFNFNDYDYDGIGKDENDENDDGKNDEIVYDDEYDGNNYHEENKETKIRSSSSTLTARTDRTLLLIENV